MNGQAHQQGDNCPQKNGQPAHGGCKGGMDFVRSEGVKNLPLSQNLDDHGEKQERDKKGNSGIERDFDKQWGLKCLFAAFYQAENSLKYNPNIKKH